MHPTSGSVHLSSTIINTSVRLPQTKNPLTIIHRFRHLSNRNSEKCRSNSVLPFPAPKNYGKRQAEFILQSKLLSISPHYHIHNRLIVPAGLIFPVLADQPFYSSCISPLRFLQNGNCAFPTDISPASNGFVLSWCSFSNIRLPASFPSSICSPA